MAINNGDTRIAIVAETTKGFTPATPAFLLVDHLPGSKIAARTLVKLDVLRPVRLFRDAVQKVRSRAN